MGKEVKFHHQNSENWCRPELISLPSSPLVRVWKRGHLLPHGWMARNFLSLLHTSTRQENLSALSSRCHLLISIQTLYISTIVLHTNSYTTLEWLVIIHWENFHRETGFSVSQFRPVAVPVPVPFPVPVPVPDPFPDSGFRIPDFRVFHTPCAGLINV